MCIFMATAGLDPHQSYQTICLSCQEAHISGWGAMEVSCSPPLLFLLLSLAPFPGTSISQNSIHGDSFPHKPQPAVAAAGPTLQDWPFAVVWNMPTERCQKLYNVHLDLGDFGIVENTQQNFQGQVIDPML